MLRKFFKRLSCFAVSAFCVLSLAVPFLAATDSNIRMTNIETATCTVAVNNGKAAATARVTGISGTEKCKIVLKIQEQQGSRWVTVDTCTVESDRYFASANSSINATAGTTYRAQATVTVWANGTAESKTVTTQGETA